MELRRSGIVWVPPGDDAISARAAGAGREVKVRKVNAPLSQLIDVWRTDIWITSATKIVEAHIIGNKYDEVGRGGDGRWLIFLPGTGTKYQKDPEQGA